MKIIFKYIVAFGMAYLTSVVNANPNSKLIVTIRPEKAIEEGGRWKWQSQDGKKSSLYRSDEIVSNIPDGDVLIEGVKGQRGKCTPPISPTKLTIRPDKTSTAELEFLNCN